MRNPCMPRSGRATHTTLRRASARRRATPARSRRCSASRQSTFSQTSAGRAGAGWRWAAGRPCLERGVPRRLRDHGGLEAVSGRRETTTTIRLPPLAHLLGMRPLEPFASPALPHCPRPSFLPPGCFCISIILYPRHLNSRRSHMFPPLHYHILHVGTTTSLPPHHHLASCISHSIFSALHPFLAASRICRLYP